MAWMAHQEDQCDQAQHWIARGRQAAALPHAPLESLAVEVLIHMGNFSGAVQTLERWGAAVEVDTGQGVQALPEMMAASARLALGSGDQASAREFARLAKGAVDDAAAVLLTQMALASDAGTPTPAVREQANAIKGHRFDTLALKLSLATDGARTWPYPVPQATRQLVDALVAR
jgi:Tfp pilus assembly protein PilF